MTLLDATTEQLRSEATSPAIRIVDLTKRYTGRTRRFRLSPKGFIESMIRGEPWETVALDKVSFSVEHGEVFGLLGPNGSGKTTLIKILSNLVLPDAGAVYIEGSNVVRKPYVTASRLQTVLSESIGLEKRISARENLRLFASLYNMPKAEAEQKIDLLMDFFGLTPFAHKTSQSFSTGMSRKLAVCRVLLSRASVIVFDEPTSGMDPSSAVEFRHLITQDLVKREGKTVFMATHNLVEATSMCDRIALLNHGSLLAIGTPEEIRRRVGDRVDLSITLGSSDGDMDELREELAKVQGVHSVRIVDALGARQIQLSGTKDLSYLEIFSLISTRRLKVVSLETSTPSLEEAFVRLTREDSK